jgi:hypothetical protein
MEQRNGLNRVNIRCSRKNEQRCLGAKIDRSVISVRCSRESERRTPQNESKGKWSELKAAGNRAQKPGKREWRSTVGARCRRGNERRYLTTGKSLERH